MRWGSASVVRDALKRLVASTATLLSPPKVIEGVDGSPYLSRWTLLDFGDDHGRVYLHRFHRGDEDQELHTHPWAWAASLILIGGYVEYRRLGEGVGWKALRPGQINVFLADTAHRIELVDGDAWTLVFAGPIVGSWGFWDRRTNAFTPWREFIAKKGMRPA